MMLLLFTNALAAAFSVPADGTIAEVVALAPIGATVQIASGYSGEPGPIYVEKDLTFIGLGARPEVPTMVVSGARAEFQNVQFAGTSPVSGIARSLAVTNGTLIVSGSAFPAQSATAIAATDSVVDLQDAAIDGRYAQRGLDLIRSQVTVRDSSFAQNTLGAISSETSILDLRSVTFIDNSAFLGADVLAFGGGTLRTFGGSSDGATAESAGGSIALVNTYGDLRDTQFRTSQSGSEGGALYFAENLATTQVVGIPVRLEGVLIQGTQAQHGGGIRATGRIALTVQGSLIQSSWADDGGTTSTGGAISQSGGWLTLQESLITSTYAFLGGGVWADDGAVVTVRDTEFDGNADATSDYNAADGGAIASIGATLLIEDSWFHDLDVLADGSALNVAATTVEIRGSTFETSHAWGFGTLFQTEGSLFVESSQFLELAASQSAVLDALGGTQDLRDLVITATSADEGVGAIAAYGAVDFRLTRARVCEAGGASLGIVAVGASPGFASISASTFHSNSPGTSGVIAHDGALTDFAQLDLSHLTLVDNRGIAVRASGPTTLHRSLLVGNDIAVSGPGITATENLYFDNTFIGAAGAAVPEAEALLEDPLFISRTGDCQADLALQSNSPAVGVPSLGATGGPDATAVDRDLDGWPQGQDCDDFDPRIHPGAPDIPLDGVDADCDGLDGDTDGDGFAPPGDCDENDPSTHPNGTDIPNDDRDQNCSGSDATSSIGGRGCTHAVGSSHLTAWLLAVGLFVRRRR